MSTNFAGRANMSPIARKWRAYFAPVDRANGRPVVFDPASDGLFDLASPPVAWIDAGWIDNMKRVPGTKISPVRSGSKGAAMAQVRTEVEARIEFEFRQWGKLQTALAAGSEQLNVLAEAIGAVRAPSGGTAMTAVAVQPRSTAEEIFVGADAVASFAVGEMIAVDVDYVGQTGYVGTGVPSAYVKDVFGLGIDYIRRVTFNVARIAEKTGYSLKLSQPLLGGAPAPDAKVQKVIAFADREGGCFFPEWSGLFVLQSESGGRVCFYYPRLQPCAPAAESTVDIATPLHALALRASFLALPFKDATDGEAVLCWRTYFPDANAAVY
ncbi:MAG TPA: hypothetical protein VD837_13285 [Terriglobales bacterium]|nr:hypothetical protein [Terriglobales bacterium]